MTERKKSWWWLLRISTVVITFALIGLLALQFRSGVQVTIQNTGTAPLKTIVLHVTGASYDLGDIAPDKSVAARVSPTGESHLEIEFVDADGKTQRMNAGDYFESGYRGTIKVEIKNGRIDKFEDNVKL